MVEKRGTARLRAQLAARVNGGEGPDRVAVLAATIQTTSVDDSLAIRFSLLLNNQTLELENHSHWLYIILWPLMMLYACWAVPKVWIFRLYWYLFHCPSFTRSEIKVSESDSAEARREKMEKQAKLNEYNMRWLLGPKHASLWFDAHWLGQVVRNGVLTSQALDGINAVPVLFLLGQLDSLGGRLVRFWLNQPDGQAVRNRLRITYNEILAELCRLWESRQPGQKIRVLSLACGSAQATIEALAVFLAAYSEAKGKVELRLVDLSGSSLMRAIHLAKERGVGPYVSFEEKNIQSIVHEQCDNPWDIVEMVGFLDYRPWESAVNICRDIRKIMRVNGLFVSAHIGPSPWSFVVRWVINWPLLIRRPIQEYRQILHQAGFTGREIEMRDAANWRKSSSARVVPNRATYAASVIIFGARFFYGIIGLYEFFHLVFSRVGAN